MEISTPNPDHHVDLDEEYSTPHNTHNLDYYYSSPWTLSPLQTPSPSLLYTCIASLRLREGFIHSIAVSKGVAFTGSTSNHIQAWRATSCAKLGHLRACSGDVRALLINADTVFSAHKDRKIRIWKFVDIEKFRAKKFLTLPRKRSLFSSIWLPKASSSHPYKINDHHKDVVSCMAYYQQEGLLYSGSNDKTVKVWRISINECVDSFVAHEDSLTSIVVNQHDGCVFTSSIDGSIKLWRRVYNECHTLTTTLRFQPSPVNALALSLSVYSNHIHRNIGNYFLYSASSDGIINFWEKEKISYTFNHGGFLQGHSFGVLCLVAVQKLIFSGSEDTTIRVWRREEGSYFHECLVVLDGHRGPVKCLSATMEIDDREGMVKGFLVYSGSLDQTFKVWKVQVLPEEKEVLWLDNECYFEENSVYDKREVMMKKSFSVREGHERMVMSPVLSPSWVERKRR